MSKQDYLAPEDLKDNGTLVEANRRFFHPIGIDMCIVDDQVVFKKLDSCSFNYSTNTVEEAKQLKSAINSFEKHTFDCKEKRMKELGFIVQPKPK